MRLKPAAKAAIRDRILDSAAAAFRHRGVDAVNLDLVMGGAGLTRGAFYSHFASKAALLAAVAAERHPLLVMLRAREGRTRSALRRELAAIFEAYLAPENLEEIRVGCTIAALTDACGRSDGAVRAGYSAGFRQIIEEMGREQPASARRRHPAVLALASGAVNAASACDDPALQAQILASAHRAAAQLLRP